MSIKLGIVGGGVMGEALLSRLIKTQIYQPAEIIVSDPQPQRRDFLHQNYRVQVTADNPDIAAATEVWLLAVKPQVFAPVAKELARMSLKEAVIISILAGVNLSKLTEVFPGRAVIRAMPNTPATVGAAMSAIAPNHKVTTQQLDLAKRIFQSVGAVLEVDDRYMDAVTGLSGSGPAFVALMLEALTDGGVAAGLSRSVAQQLALQTILGTAQLLKESNLHPAQLKDQVTSPGGTTIAGVLELERSGFRAALINAVLAAKERSIQLGQ